MNADGFEIGDVVTWTSQAQGHHKTKRGTVVEVVRAKTMPKRRPRGCGWERKAVSYIVAIELPRSTKLYWPVASLLKLSEARP